MSTSRNFYFMIKPPPSELSEITRHKRALGIEDNYDPARLHVTLDPLGSEKEWSESRIGWLDAILARFLADPFYIEFDRIEENALRGGGEALRAIRAFRGSLIRHLARSGLILPTRRFNPHLTLAYGQDSDCRVTIDPIGWTVNELLLIRSGDGRHAPFGRWPLIQRQPNLPLF
ncbi:MAG: hypothetical protein J0I25_00505 [Sphingomonadales bacterium]|nr:hypothetical protein [Sphingomonadales bacterium]